jgi:uncharacterized protein (TIGR02722 family)
MTIKFSTLVFLGACTLPTLYGCSSMPEVERIDPNKEKALTDRWNSQDSKLVANEMIDDMLSFPWARDFELDHNVKPTIIIQRIQNKSHEHIAIDTFINEIKRSVIRSGRANFVVAGNERQQIRDERTEQELNSKKGKQQGVEKAADYALSGSLNSIVDQYKKQRVTFYQVDLKLIDMESNIEVWNGQKKIQKIQKK